MQDGRLIDAALQARSERYVSEIFEALRRRVGGLPLRTSRSATSMIMNAAFLVGRALEEGVRRPGQGHRPALRQAHVQVHRSVAALQLREHQAQAGESALDCGLAIGEFGLGISDLGLGIEDFGLEIGDFGIGGCRLDRRVELPTRQS